MTTETTKVIKIKRSLFTVDKNGTTKSAVIPINFDPQKSGGLFWVGLPPWVKSEDGNNVIAGETMGEVVAKYEAACDAYSVLTLAKRLPLKLWVTAVVSDCDPVQLNVPGAHIALRYVEVVVAGDKVHVLSGGMTGMQFNIKDLAGHVLLDDTSEIRAKLDSLIASIKTAGEILTGIGKSPDPAAYLLAIADNLGSVATATPAAQGDLFDPSTAPKTPAKPVVDDDEL